MIHQQAFGIEVLPGVEISTLYESRVLHILGYLFRLDDPLLTQKLEVIQKSRAERNKKIVQKLQKLGCDISYDELLEVGGEGQIGRPHIAQVLVEKRIADNLDHAFKKFLKRGRPAYADRYRLQPDEAIQIILQAGGVPVLAHPSSLKTTSDRDLDPLIGNLKKQGLKGIEAHYPGHGPVNTARYERLARRHGLLVTGGTDFHGSIKPGVHLGVGHGDLRIPYKVVEDLKRAAGDAH